MLADPDVSNRRHASVSTVNEHTHLWTTRMGLAANHCERVRRGSYFDVLPTEQRVGTPVAGARMTPCEQLLPQESFLGSNLHR